MSGNTSEEPSKHSSKSPLFHVAGVLVNPYCNRLRLQMNMNLRIIPIILLAALIVGCKPKDDSSTSATTGTATADAKPADDSKAPGTADASGNTIVGTWTMDDKTIKDASMEFKDNGDLEIKAPWPQPKGATLEVDATYKLAGDQLTLHMVGTKMLAPDGADDKLKKEVEAANKALANGPKQPDETDTLAWKDKDTFTTTDPKKKVVTYTRKA